MFHSKIGLNFPFEDIDVYFSFIFVFLGRLPLYTLHRDPPPHPPSSALFLLYEQNAVAWQLVARRLGWQNAAAAAAL